ncbi:RNA polymerase sigma factor [Ilumatobacter sp.]|uniref:RNA polymerase sigma factor n=1 Tax=Ilumatobacter sp. TaxID=1967498 RepID=UPI003B517AB0
MTATPSPAESDGPTTDEVARPVEPDRGFAASETIVRARAGDEDALATIWEIHHPQVVRLLRARRVDSVDIVARRVWEQVGRSMADFSGDGRDLRRRILRAASRLGSAAERRAVEPDQGGSARHEGDRRPTPFDRPGPSSHRPSGDPADDDAADAPGVADASDGPSDVDDEDSIDQAIRTLSTLPPVQAEAVLLWLVLDLGVEEISSITGRSHGDVRTSVRLGVTSLNEAAGDGAHAR